MTCTTCSAKLPQGAAYCGTCGTRTPTGKGREASTGVLFARRYRIEGKLAAGGFGAIYRATQVKTGVAVAVKVLHRDLANDPTLCARFRREAAVLASLRDPHTIKTYEHGEAPDGTPYIVMELLTGKNLQAELAAQGPLPWWRTLAIMRGVCSSLREAHALGLVHRDLKPANIHLEQRGDEADFVKVLDFGIVKVLGGGVLTDELDITRVGQAVGTLDYMSPEQITGGETDHRTDIYTLGVVAYEMLTGRRPFSDATTATSLLTALMTRTAEAPSTLFHRDCFPAAVDRLLLRCLESDPEHRFANVGEVVEAIDEIFKYAPPSTLVGRTPRTGRSPVAAVITEAPRPTAVRGSVPRPAKVRASNVHESPVSSALSLAETVPPVPTLLPLLEMPAPAPVLVPAPRAPGARGASPMLASSDDGDSTNVDVVPLPDAPWTPALERRGDRRARTPHLAEPPEPPTFRAARGSTVSVSPYRMPEPPRRRGALKLAAWAGALLASGIGLGMLVASLC